jgi:hypothetical protein
LTGGGMAGEQIARFAAEVAAALRSG